MKEAKGDDGATADRVSRFQSMFGGKKKQKLQEDTPKMNVKGHKNYSSGAGVAPGGLYPEVNQGTIERQFYGLE